MALFAVGLGGCNAPTSDQPATPQAGEAVRLLVLDNPPLATELAALAGQWKATTGAELTVVEANGAEAVADKGWPQADAVIFPIHALATLAEEQRIVPLDAQLLRSPGLAWNDNFDLLRLREATWGEQPYAVPLGSATLVLFYRADLLRHLGRNPPTTWNEYADLARLLDDRANLGELAPPHDRPWNGVAEPLAPNWAASTLLARAAAYARHPENYSALFDIATLEPLVGGKPFVRALDELREAGVWGPENCDGLTPDEVRRAFWAGECGMALTWSSPADPKLAGLAPVEAGVAELPGATEAYDNGQSQWEPRSEEAGIRVPLLGFAGRMGGIVADAKNPVGAGLLLSALATQPWAAGVWQRQPDATLWRRSQVAQADRWVEPAGGTGFGAQYAAAIQATLERSDSLAALSLPGRSQYWQLLDDAVRASLKDDKPAENRLKSVAEKWREISQTLGTDRQLRAYRRSLGLEP
ncbi:MAG: extracellular solute-binding protein [Pirellulales bacterium]|nr:extracellular solute-binding protein [Pirellulales bacterium]